MENQALVLQLENETRAMSSISAMQRSAAYAQLRSLGADAIPDLLEALRQDRAPHAVMALLAEITGENPIPDTDRGVTRRMIRHWSVWGQNYMNKIKI